MALLRVNKKTIPLPPRGNGMEAPLKRPAGENPTGQLIQFVSCGSFSAVKFSVKIRKGFSMMIMFKVKARL